VKSRFFPSVYGSGLTTASCHQTGAGPAASMED
jgi:hypothetical protein